MKRKVLSLAMIAALCLTMLPTAGWAADETIDDWQEPTPPADVSGSWVDTNNYDISWYTGHENDNSYTLTSADQLAGLAALSSGVIKDSRGNSTYVYFSGKTINLTENATYNLSGKEWMPIQSFQGTFDGKNATITGLTIGANDEGSTIVAGLFSYGMSGTIKELKLKDVYIKTTNEAGGVVARTDTGSSVENCSVEGDIISNGGRDSWAGGVVGKNVGTVKNCSFKGSVSGTTGPIGGIVGLSYSSSSIIESCTNSGRIEGPAGPFVEYAAGGIVGMSSGTVKDCTNDGVIAGRSPRSGGIVGTLQCKAEKACVTDCENTGTINAQSNFLGGIVGSTQGTGNVVGKITNCTNSATITGNSDKYNVIPQAGGILGGLEKSTLTVTIDKCANLGAVSAGYSYDDNGRYGVGGIVGANNVSGTLTISESYNTGAITATEATTIATGAGGLLGSASPSTPNTPTITIQNSYNTGAVSGGTNTGVYAGGIIGYLVSGAQETITSVYSVGMVSGDSGKTGALIGNNINAPFTNVYYWDKCGATGTGISKTANQLTSDDWAAGLGFSTDLWSKTDNDGGENGNLPVLKNKTQAPAPTLKLDQKQAQADLTITAPEGLFETVGDKENVVRENHVSFTLNVTGGSTDNAVQWSLTSGDGIVTIDQSTGEISLTNNAFGDVTVTATKPGNDTYSDTSASFTFYVKPLDIAKVTFSDLHAPVMGVSPDMEAKVPEDAHYEGMTSVSLGNNLVHIAWVDEYGKVLTQSDSFEQGVQYTATVRLQADDHYDWAKNVAINIEGLQDDAIKSVTTKTDSQYPDNLIITVVFNPTSHVHSWSTEWSSDGLYHWYECLNDGCTETASGSQGYAKHTDSDNNDICDTCEATIGYTITFNANGGACTTASARTDLDGKITTLPEASRDGYTFRGWFTAASGGEQVNVDKVYSADTTLYAQWEKIPEPPYTGKYSYEIFTDDSDHGALDVDRYATEGEKVTITVLPDDGYALDEIVITDKRGEEIDFVNNGDGTITFTMPSGDVTITATFVESDEPECTLPFVDVHANDWFFDPVCYVYSEGLMTGTSATTFAPNATTTRAMIVSILARQENVTSAEDAGFTDVAENDWYATAVNWAAREGIVTGFEDDSFRPNAAITREQLAAILCNYSAWKGKDTSARADLDEYTDAISISSWATDTMSWAVAEQLLAGVTENTLEPQGAATRAQVAAVLQRFLSE